MESVLSQVLEEVMSPVPHVLIIEPLYGGSHRQFIDTLLEGLKNKIKVSLHLLPSKKWHWRARTSALYFYESVPRNVNFNVIFASSVLNLAELLALRPDLALCKKVLFFHENQLVYPVQHVKERDFQYGYNQILSCLVADKVVFNSNYNMESFISNINKFFKLQPDYRPKNLPAKIEPKCEVLYVPLMFPNILHCEKEETLHIVWPHRWEHDKNPGMFLRVISSLRDQKFQFYISFIGKTCDDTLFQHEEENLKDNIKTWGYVQSKEDYYKLLSSCHIAVSTAKHEFFGISMLEAVSCGCFPLCPNSLVYPEIFPDQCLYKNEKELLERLVNFCKVPQMAVKMRKELNIDLSKFSVDELIPKYESLLTDL